MHKSRDAIQLARAAARARALFPPHSVSQREKFLLNYFCWSYYY